MYRFITGAVVFVMCPLKILHITLYGIISLNVLNTFFIESWVFFISIMLLCDIYSCQTEPYSRGS